MESKYLIALVLVIIFGLVTLYHIGWFRGYGAGMDEGFYRGRYKK